jgi:pimeloyl-ACP methyl ester carboxylesterase
MWDDQFGVFAARHRVLRHDLRGFGRSAMPRDGEAYTHADDLRALLGWLGIGRTALVGLSLGGWVCLEFALTYPELVSAVVLVDAALREYSFSSELSGRLGTLYRVGREEGTAAARERWLADPLFASANGQPGVAARLAEMIEGYNGWHFQHDDPHPPMVPAAIRRLSEVTLPTLIVVGERDLPDFHTIAGLLAAEISGARRVNLDGAGHMANMEASVAFNEAVLGFLGVQGGE